MNKKITVEELLESGAHFGHPTSRWDPNYLPYIATKKNGIHIINLNETIKNEVQKELVSNNNINSIGSHLEIDLKTTTNRKKRHPLSVAATNNMNKNNIPVLINFD